MAEKWNKTSSQIILVIAIFTVGREKNEKFQNFKTEADVKEKHLSESDYMNHFQDGWTMKSLYL